MNLKVEEEWRPVVGFEGLYCVSSLGRVKNRKGLILAITKDKKGYDQYNLLFCGKQKNYPIHRIVAKAFIPNPDNLPTVNHKNLDRLDNRADNLEWMSFRDNTIHALKARGKYKDIRGLIEQRRLNFKPKQFYVYDYRNCLIGIFHTMSEVGVFCKVSTVSAYEYLKTGKLSPLGFKVSNEDLEPEFQI